MSFSHKAESMNSTLLKSKALSQLILVTQEVLLLGLKVFAFLVVKSFMSQVKSPSNS